MYVDPTLVLALSISGLSLALLACASLLLLRDLTRAPLSAADEAEIAAWLALDAKLCRMNDPRLERPELRPVLAAAERQGRELRRVYFLLAPLSEKYKGR